MSAHTLGHYRHSTRHRGAGTHDTPGTSFAKGDVEHLASNARTESAVVKELLIVLSPIEVHREVAIRAQLLLRDTPISRTFLITRYSPKWQRLAKTISSLGTHVCQIGTDVSERVLRASVPGRRVHVEASVSAADVARHGYKSDLVLVGRRRTFPWSLVPLARYARLLLRRSRTPLLIVGAVPSSRYRNVVIATDLRTDVSAVLELAKHIAPAASLTLLHVYRGLFESSLRAAGVRDADIAEHRRAAQRTASLGLARLLQRHGSVDRAVLAHGSAVHDVVRKARELGADLIVVVKSTHSLWAELLGVSISLEIATWADRDVLVAHAASSRTYETHSADATSQ
jgi:nucleotide-binding universal stress UspA family protein